MIWTGIAALAACGLARASLESNIAYRSPSTTVNGLAVEASHLEKRKIQGTYQGQVNFTYGVASGDPYANSVILWTHPVPQNESSGLPICLKYAVSPQENMTDVTSYGQVWTTADVDYSVKVEAIGLEPWQKYYYQFTNCASANNTSPVGAFKTMPRQNDDEFEAVSFAVYSCSNYPFGFFNAYSRPSIEDSVDYVVHTGDYIYESQGDGGGNSYGNGTAINRIPSPNKDILTLEDYRERYKTYRADLDLQELHRTHAWQLIWDDHEVADNAWANGTAKSNDTIAGTFENVTFTERKASAVRAYFEWMPIRQVDTNDHLRIWRKFRFGTLADLIMLDTRNYERDITDLYYNTASISAIRDEEDRSLMGARQEAWFHDSLIDAQESNVEWKVVGNQVLFAHVNYSTPTFQINDDAWDGYTANRERILNTIAGNNIDNLIMLAGDTHVNWVSDIVDPSSLLNGTYDPATGQGALGVEFAGTAVSSPSSYGRNLNISAYTATAQHLVDVNSQLQWAEGAYRGYFELHLNRQNATAMFYGYPDILTRNTNVTLLATFTVDKDANKLSRPVAGGEVQGGALKK